MQCPKCDGTLTRSHRRGPERFIFSHTFRCRDCSYRVRESHLQTGLFGKFAECPRCGNIAPDKRKKPDRVDSMLHSPLRFLHWLMGGQLYHCVFCRLQFYDRRPLRPRVSKPETRPEPARDTAAASKARMAS